MLGPQGEEGCACHSSACSAPACLLSFLTLPRTGGEGRGVTGKGFPEVLSKSVFFCRALPHLSAKLYGQSLYSFHNHLP